MKKSNIIGLLALFVMALVAQSCGDDDNTSATGLTVTSGSTMVNSVDFNVGESTTVLAINTDGDWQVSIPDADTTWLKVTPHEGYGWRYTDSTATNLNSYVKLTALANSGNERQTTLTVTAGQYVANIPVTQKGQGLDAGDPFESAFTMVQGLKFGYNLGNTLESNADTSLDWFNPTTVYDWETVWGQPVTTQEMIDDIVAKGFNIIRVPVTWWPHMDANGKIDDAWMARVKEVVGYVLNTGSYCIINVMHDTGAKDASRTDDANWLYADMDTYPEQTKRFQNIWQQVATAFKDYDEKLIFESFNEILDKNSSWSAPSASSTAYEAINRLQQDFVNTVRATGGNNEWRNLAVTSYAATANTKVALDQFDVPTDVHPGHIYATFHSYDPYNFCSDNSGIDAAGNAYDWNIYIWDSTCEQEVDQIFAQVYDRCNSLGIPFLFGEFGAIAGKKEMSERVKYATYLATKMKQYNTTGLWWMGLYDRNTRTWTESEIVDALAAVLK